MKNSLLIIVFMILMALGPGVYCVYSQVDNPGDHLKAAMDKYRYESVSLDWRENNLSGEIELDRHELLMVDAAILPASGYQWIVTSYDSTLLKHIVLPECLANEAGHPGEVVDQRLLFEGKAGGTASIHLTYKRPWEEPSRAVAYRSLKVKVRGGYRGEMFVAPRCQEPTPALSLKDYHSDTLPVRFDWRDHGGVTPVKDQGSCGSCWAFGTAAMFEAAILINDGVVRDLSEQFLVSCLSEFNGCEGGWWALPYYVDEGIVGDSVAGAVYEEHFPYGEADLDCNPPYMHYEKASGWGYVDGKDDDNRPTISHMATITQIKEAILKYGPVGTDVCSDTWSGYSGGVHTQDCGNKNHIVLITGWDDDQQCWFIKNSWGKNWGEQGYMRLGYGHCEVGSYSTWIDYRPQNPRLVYHQGTFWEGPSNNGAFDNPLTVKLLDGQLSVSDTLLDEDLHYTSENLPEGLDVRMLAKGDSMIKIYLDGRALSHAHADDRNDLVLNFTDSAFAHTGADSVLNHSFRLIVDFNDPYSIQYNSLEDITCHAGNYWIPFDLGAGNAEYAAWFNDGNLRLETYGKACVSEGTSTNITPLAIGTVIGPDNNWVKGGKPIQHFISHAYYDAWKDKEAFIGIRFKIREHTHFGWLRVEVDSMGGQFTIKDYGYNQQPGMPVKAGQQSHHSQPPEAEFEADSDTLYTGEKVVFTNKSLFNPLQYRWTFEGGVPGSSSKTNPEVTYPQAGSFDVALKVYNSEGKDSLINRDYITVLAPVSTNTQVLPNERDYSVYPNPASHDWYLKLSSGEDQPERMVRIYNALGSCVIEKTIHPDQQQISFSRRSFSEGIYFIVVSDRNGMLYRTSLVFQ